MIVILITSYNYSLMGFVNQVVTGGGGHCNGLANVGQIVLDEIQWNIIQMLMGRNVTVVGAGLYWLVIVNVEILGWLV